MELCLIPGAVQATELQAAADSVRKGVVMYSEGMAVTKDMPGIISGRVHNAIYLSPELNLNKLIKPDFSIFRVCDVGEDIIHREIAISFFNGYGTELNMFSPAEGMITTEMILIFLHRQPLFSDRIMMHFLIMTGLL